VRKQSAKVKKGEIEFRKYLSRQHVMVITIFPYEYDQQEILNVLKNRVEKSEVDFKILKTRNIPLSPFLEIGAERCQRANPLLTNRSQAYGVATDISIGSLKTAQYFRRQLKMETMPERVCCDAYNLPFRNGAFAFAFCYQTLHHFPDPTPILTEVKDGQNQRTLSR